MKEGAQSQWAGSVCAVETGCWKTEDVNKTICCSCSLNFWAVMIAFQLIPFAISVWTVGICFVPFVFFFWGWDFFILFCFSRFCSLCYLSFNVYQICYFPTDTVDFLILHTEYAELDGLLTLSCFCFQTGNVNINWFAIYLLLLFCDTVLKLEN